MPLMEYLQELYNLTTSGSIVIGYGLVVESIDPDGHRQVFKLTSDASGLALPWYTVKAFADCLETMDEVDDVSVYNDDEEMGPP